jgi:hypothetical protein
MLGRVPLVPETGLTSIAEASKSEPDSLVLKSIKTPGSGIPGS